MIKLLFTIFFDCIVNTFAQNSGGDQQDSKNLFGGAVYDDYSDEVTEIPVTIETVVWYPLRIWHLAAIAATFLTTIIVIVCCCNDFRIPRTKEQIEADKERKKMTTKYTQEMNELCFGTAGTRMVVPPMDPTRKQKPGPGQTTTAPSTNRKLYLPKSAVP